MFDVIVDLSISNIFKPSYHHIIRLDADNFFFIARFLFQKIIAEEIFLEIRMPLWRIEKKNIQDPKNFQENSNLLVKLFPRTEETCTGIQGSFQGPGVPRILTDFDRSVNPISTRGTEYAHLITTGTPGFSDLPTAFGNEDTLWISISYEIVFLTEFQSISVKKLSLDRKSEALWVFGAR